MSLPGALGTVLMLGAAFFFVAGTVALARFPDTLSRLHALTKVENVGLGLLVLGLALRAEDPASAGLLLAVWVLVLITSGPLAALLGRFAARSPGESGGP